MKKIVLLFAAALSLASANAQVLNSSFENWTTDTSIIGLVGFLPNDTFSYNEPVSWTSSNALTGHDSLGGVFNATQSTDANTGSSALRLETGLFKLPVIGLQIGFPAFAISGDFKLNLNTITGGFDLTSLPGAGFAISGRQESISGFYKFTPNAPNADSLAVIAVLRKGQEVVATATFYNKNTVSNYTQFTAPFVYSSCETPDSAVIVISSSDPFAVAALLSGGGAPLAPGSVLTVDDVTLTAGGSGFVVPPIARRDAASTKVNTPVTINLTTNDEDCQSLPLTVTNIHLNAQFGTVVLNGNSATYTPANNFFGVDSFQYTLSNGTKTSIGSVVIDVEDPSAVADYKLIPVAAYPNPAVNEVVIRADVATQVSVVVTDLIGKVVAKEVMTNNAHTVSTTQLANGTYIITLVDNKNTLVGRTKVNIAK